MECLICFGIMAIAAAVFGAILLSRQSNREGNNPPQRTMDERVLRSRPNKSTDPSGVTITTSVYGPAMHERDVDGFELNDNFFNRARRSPSSRFVAGTGQKLTPRTRTSRDAQGVVALVDKRSGSVCWINNMDSPQRVDVTDRGDVLVLDWLDRSEMEGACVCFGANGNARWRKKYDVNVLDLGVSGDGRYCYVSTASGQYRADANTTFVYELATGDELFRLGYRADDIRFKGNRLVRVVETQNGGERTFPFDNQGALPDEFYEFRKEQKTLRAEADPTQAIYVLRDELKRDEPDLERIERILNAAKRKSDQLDESGRARLHRYAGQLAKRRGDLAEAVERWEMALSLDENVGVKTRLKKARKKLAKKTYQETGDDSSDLVSDYQKYKAAFDEAEHLRKSGRGPGAVPHFESALKHAEGASEFDSGLPPAPYRKFAKMLYHMGRDDRAVEVLERYERFHAERGIDLEERAGSKADTRKLKERLDAGDFRRLKSKHEEPTTEAES